MRLDAKNQKKRTRKNGAVRVTGVEMELILMYFYLVRGLEPWNFIFFHILGMEKSAHLTKSIIFQRGGYTNHQPVDVWKLGVS